MFSYAEIGILLKRANEAVGLFPFRDWDGKPGIILRHDVDLDVLPAWQLAQVELDVGVRSTFFFLVTSETYNVASSSNRRMLRDLSASGFEIGLHFDCAMYPDADHELLESRARDEARWLADIAGTEVKTVSIHNPDHYGRTPLFDSFLNAYDSRIFSKEIYSSDSRMIFRTPPESLLEIGKTRTAQLNLHPEHYSATGGDYPEAMVSFVDRVIGTVHQVFAPNSSYVKAVGSDLHAHVRKHLNSEGAR